MSAKDAEAPRAVVESGECHVNAAAEKGIVMLFSKRKRLAELSKSEAEGVVPWSPIFEEKARLKIFYAIIDSAGDSGIQTVTDIARGSILREEGLPFLSKTGLDPKADFLNSVMKWPDHEVPTLVESVGLAIELCDHQHRMLDFGSWERFISRINEILREHRISFEFIDGRMIEFTSREMHVSVVEPTVRLLASNSEFAAAEGAYQDALREIAASRAANAITDAGRALQEALTVLGCEGNALGPLATSAVKKGFLSAYDRKLVDWVAADRSQAGDAHQSTGAQIEDAWLTVHIVGAIILRMSSSTKRSLVSAG